MKRLSLGSFTVRAIKWLIVIAGYLVFVLPNAWAASVLYSQPLIGNSLLASENDTSNGNANYATMYDDFTLKTDATVTDVHWIGGAFGGDPVGGTGVTAFTVTFWPDSAGQPGSGSLYSEYFPGNANETFDSNVGSFTLFDYSVDLTTPLSATAGTTYWMSVVAWFPGPGPTETGPVWGWADGSGGDNLSYQDVPFPPPTGVMRLSGPSDLAFQLTGTAVPEPSTLLLFGAGLAGIGILRRRLRK